MIFKSFEKNVSRSCDDNGFDDDRCKKVEFMRNFLCRNSYNWSLLSWSYSIPLKLSRRLVAVFPSHVGKYNTTCGWNIDFDSELGLSSFSCKYFWEMSFSLCDSLSYPSGDNKQWLGYHQGYSNSYHQLVLSAKVCIMISK